MKGERRIELIDTTLRDGIQQEGISVTGENVLAVGEKLIAIGVPLIEIGKSSNSHSEDVLRALAEKMTRTSTIIGFSDTNQSTIDSFLDYGIDKISICDPGLQGDFITNLDQTAEAVKHAAELRLGEKKFKKIFVYLPYTITKHEAALSDFCKSVKKYNPNIIYSDAQGIAYMESIRQDIPLIRKHLKKIQKIYFHGHNYGGIALGNSIAAIEAEADGVVGSFLGLGTGCGNAAVEQLLYHLINNKYNIRHKLKKLGRKQVEAICSNIAGELSIEIPFRQPIVGRGMVVQHTGGHVRGSIGHDERWSHEQGKLIVAPSYQNNRQTIVKMLNSAGIVNPPNMVVKRLLRADKEIFSLDAKKLEKRFNELYRDESFIEKYGKEEPISLPSIHIPESMQPTNEEIAGLYEGAMENAGEYISKAFKALIRHEMRRINNTLPNNSINWIKAASPKSLKKYVETKARTNKKTLIKIKYAYLVLITKVLLNKQNDDFLDDIPKWLADLYILELEILLFHEKKIKSVDEKDLKAKIKLGFKLRERNEDRLDIYEYFKVAPEKLIELIRSNRDYVKEQFHIP